MVKQKFRYASTLGQDHLSQRWRNFTFLGSHNNLFRKKIRYSKSRDTLTYIYLSIDQNLAKMSNVNVSSKIWFLCRHISQRNASHLVVGFSPLCLVTTRLSAAAPADDQPELSMKSQQALFQTGPNSAPTYCPDSSQRQLWRGCCACVSLSLNIFKVNGNEDLFAICHLPYANSRVWRLA